MTDKTDQTIDGRYRLNQKLGEGAMGVVYQGEIIESNTVVAIKALKPQVVKENPTRLERFIREAELLYQLEHPHIVKVLDTVRFNGVYFIVMEYMDGGSLRGLMDDEKQLPVQFTLETALDLSDALIRTHRMKIIHRDVKPDNVLLDSRGLPRLTDFGAAHITDANTLTQHGAFIGTMHYMSPEILRGVEVDHRADIWSFGVMIYEMLTGFRPFMGRNFRDLIFAVLNQPVPNIDKLRPDLPPVLVTLVHSMLEKDRDNRPNSMRAVGLELEQALEEL